MWDMRAVPSSECGESPFSRKPLQRPQGSKERDVNACTVPPPSFLFPLSLLSQECHVLSSVLCVSLDLGRRRRKWQPATKVKASLSLSRIPLRLKDDDDDGRSTTTQPMMFSSASSLPACSRCPLSGLDVVRIRRTSVFQFHDVICHINGMTQHSQFQT